MNILHQYNHCCENMAHALKELACKVMCEKTNPFEELRACGNNTVLTEVLIKKFHGDVDTILLAKEYVIHGRNGFRNHVASKYITASYGIDKAINHKRSNALYMLLDAYPILFDDFRATMEIHMLIICIMNVSSETQLAILPAIKRDEELCNRMALLFDEFHVSLIREMSRHIPFRYTIFTLARLMAVYGYEDYIKYTQAYDMTLVVYLYVNLLEMCQPTAIVEIIKRIPVIRSFMLTEEEFDMNFLIQKSLARQQSPILQKLSESNPIYV